MARKQSSSKMSKLASKYLDMKAVEFKSRMMNDPNNIFGDIKALAGSVLSQDEKKGK